MENNPNWSHEAIGEATAVVIDAVFTGQLVITYEDKVIFDSEASTETI